MAYRARTGLVLGRLVASNAVFRRLEKLRGTKSIKDFTATLRIDMEGPRKQTLAKSFTASLKKLPGKPVVLLASGALPLGTSSDR